MEEEIHKSIELKPRVDFYRVRSGFWCLALGDALGVPFEFKNNFVYSDELKYRSPYTNTYLRINKIKVNLGIGQYSDDTEMALSLARSLVEKKMFDVTSVANAYIEWAHSGTYLMGRHTQELFKRTGNYTKYSKKYKELYGVEPTESFEKFCVRKEYNEKAENDQSNGSLMRCYSLACLWDKDCAEKDSCLTNPSSVNCDINKLYVNLIRMALMGSKAKEIWEYTLSQASIHPKISEILTNIQSGKEMNVSGKSKGWVVNSFYIAMMCLANQASDKPMSFRETMAWIIRDHPGSDTDTNAAIVGMLLGPIIGWDALISDDITKRNFEKMYNMTETDLQRPLKYRFNDIEDLCLQLTYLSAL